MRLKKLQLQGFKTFAERTEIEFAPGVTAIVGPNGSGRSNLVEAGASFTGRDIKDAVLRAATQAAIEGSPNVSQSHLLSAIQKLSPS